MTAVTVYVHHLSLSVPMIVLEPAPVHLAIGVRQRALAVHAVEAEVTLIHVSIVL
jgi:hypothetical protein